MPRAGSLALIAMMVAAAESLVPISATAGSEQSEPVDPVIVTLPSRAQFPSLGPRSDPTVGPMSQFAIAREAQKELRRVGCYEGESTGIWSLSSRLAAQRFVDRVNAKLPTDKPDEILLALLRDQSGAICGQCQRDQAVDPSGRCMPTALITKSSTPRSIATDPTSDNVRSDRASADQTQTPPDTAASRRSLRPANTATKSWSGFIKKVDRALGLN
jgi:hypothetical protein